MALPQDGQNANGLTKVTEIPKGKELIFIDPTTNEGGIITLEDLTTQILKNLTSQTFTLDQGNITLIEALNKLNSKAECEKDVVKSGSANDLLKPGNYYLYREVSDMPSESFWRIKVWLTANAPTQLAISNTADMKVYIRIYSNTAWLDWKKIA